VTTFAGVALQGRFRVVARYFTVWGCLSFHGILWASIEQLNVSGHRADEMNQTTGYAASEAPGGPRC